jgi:enediyne biosynthesis protein E4
VIPRRPTAAALALLAGACGGDPQAPPQPQASTPRAESGPAAPRFRFVDRAKAAGLDAIAWCGRPEKPHLLESGGGGVALLDYDGDGRLDVLVTSGWRLAGDRVVEKPGNRLYRNRGNATYEDVTVAAGLVDGGWATGVAVADYDLDGRPDLFIANFGEDVLWRNEGGRFAKVEGAPGIVGWSSGASFFDADGDGWPDLYVAAYCDVTLDEVLHAQPTLDWKGAKVMKGPFGLKGKADAFFRNDHGRFVPATAATGLVDVGDYYGFATAAADFDVDGDLDLYVANDSNPGYLFRNDGAKFTECGLWCGAGLSGSGESQAGMGVGVGDFDGDGLPDFLLTTFADDAATLFRNMGRGLFRDVSAETGVRDPSFKPLKWGVVLADFDLDGDEDAFIACGHIYPQADTTPGTTTTFAQRNLLLENTGGRFVDATADAGPGLAIALSSRGVAVGDLDDDGDLDLVVSNVDAPPTLLVNESAREGRRWLEVDAPGALRVAVAAGGRTTTRFFVAGGSYFAASDPRFHFGLGPAAKADKVVVRWQGGGETVLTDVNADQVLRVKRP